MINLTPHPILIRTPQGETTLPPSGTIARVKMGEEVLLPTKVGSLDVPVISRVEVEVEGLPSDRNGEACLVSSMVLGALPLGQPRPEVFAPDTGPTAIRDEDGRIIAVTRLVRG